MNQDSTDNQSLFQQVSEQPFSFLDWALIGLLQAVRSEVIDPLIEGWDKSIDSVNDTNESACKFLYNLEHGLNFFEPDYLTNESKYKNWDNKRRSNLKFLLERHGKKLFNSYYYVAMHSYGDTGEYYFFPVVPNKSSLPRGPLSEEQNQFDSYIDSLGLPFKLRGDDRLAQYSGTLLPGKVGLTPQLCLNSKNDSEQKVYEIPLFLNDLAVIGKAEDVAQHHLSAIVAPMIVGGNCLGAFVLTCSIPYAFQRVLTSKSTPGNTLKKVIKQWTQAPLNILHKDARKESVDAHVAIKWRQLDNFEIPKNILKVASEKWLHTHGENGAVALFWKHNYEAKICAINPDSFALGMRSILSVGPLLSLNTYADEKQNAQNVVSPDILKTKLEQLQLLSGITNSTQISEGSFDFLKQFIILETAPFNKYNGDVAFAAVSGDEVSVVVAYSRQDQNDSKWVNECITKIHKQVLEGFVPRRQRLPGERASVFAKLEFFQHQRHHFNGSQVLSDKASKAFCSIDNLLRDKSIFGIFVFENATVFVPSSDKWPPIIHHAIFNSACFWVFEKICRLITMKAFPVHRVFKSDYSYSVPFLAVGQHDAIPTVKVKLSYDNDTNLSYISALNYLGVPVCEWLQPESTNSANLEILACNADEHIMEFYRDYLKGWLRSKGGKVPAISRASETVFSKNPCASIDSIILEDPTGSDLDVRFTLKCRVNHQVHNLDFVWTPINTWRLEFAHMDFSKISQSQFSIRSDEPKSSAKYWHPRHNWVDLHEPPAFYIETIASLNMEIEKKRKEQQEKQRSDALHESQDVIRAANRLVRLVSELPGPRAKAKSCFKTFLSDWKQNNRQVQVNPKLITQIKDTASATDDEIGLYWIHLNTHEKAIDGFFVNIATLASNTYDDISKLARFATRQGVDAACQKLGDVEEFDLEEVRTTWINQLVGLTKERLEGQKEILDRVRLHFNHDETKGEHRLNILIVVKTLSNLYKHSLLEFQKLTNNDVLYPEKSRYWEPFRREFNIILEQDIFRTSNLCAASINNPKKSGTYRVIEQYLTDPVWKDNPGDIKWDTQIKDDKLNTGIFTCEQVLPINFWYRVKR